MSGSLLSFFLSFFDELDLIFIGLIIPSLLSFFPCALNAISDSSLFAIFLSIGLLMLDDYSFSFSGIFSSGSGGKLACASDTFFVIFAAILAESLNNADVDPKFDYYGTITAKSYAGTSSEGSSLLSMLGVPATGVVSVTGLHSFEAKTVVFVGFPVSSTFSA
jgi:hypothetical protein